MRVQHTKYKYVHDKKGFIDRTIISLTKCFEIDIGFYPNQPYLLVFKIWNKPMLHQYFCLDSFLHYNLSSFLDNVMFFLKFSSLFLFYCLVTAMFMFSRHILYFITTYGFFFSQVGFYLMASYCEF